MPTQCRVCEKQRKRGTKLWQVLDVVCVDDNGDPHVNNGRGNKFGDIFPASGGIEPGRNSFQVVSLGHWVSSVLLLQIRDCLRWSDLLLRLCALPAAPLSAIVNMLNKRGESGEDCTWRGRQSGPTRSMAVRKQVPHQKKYFLLMLYCSWGPRVCQHSYIFKVLQRSYYRR